MLDFHCSQKRPAGNRANTGFLVVAACQQQKFSTFYTQSLVDQLGILLAAFQHCTKQPKNAGLEIELTFKRGSMHHGQAKVSHRTHKIEAPEGAFKMVNATHQTTEIPAMRKDLRRYWVVNSPDFFAGVAAGPPQRVIPGSA
jgi:hypothetical protein